MSCGGAKFPSLIELILNALVALGGGSLGAALCPIRAPPPFAAIPGGGGGAGSGGRAGGADMGGLPGSTGATGVWSANLVVIGNLNISILRQRQVVWAAWAQRAA